MEKFKKCERSTRLGALVDEYTSSTLVFLLSFSHKNPIFKIFKRETSEVFKTLERGGEIGGNSYGYLGIGV